MEELKAITGPGADEANWSPQTSDGGGGSAEPTGAISLPDAMQKQFCIGMKMQKQPVEVLVVDRLERKPTEK